MIELEKVAKKVFDFKKELEELKQNINERLDLLSACDRKLNAELEDCQAVADEDDAPVGIEAKCDAIDYAATSIQKEKWELEDKEEFIETLIEALDVDLDYESDEKDGMNLKANDEMLDNMTAEDEIVTKRIMNMF